MAAALISSINQKEKGGLLFGKASVEALIHLERRIVDKAPTFLSSLNPVFIESAQVAHMLTHLANGFESGENRKTFFTNSHLEGVHGAIKLARHAVSELKGHEKPSLLFLDEEMFYQFYFDPFGAGPEEALIPMVYFTKKREAVERLLVENNCRILLMAPSAETSPKSIAATMRVARKHDCLVILSTARLSLEAVQLFMPLFKDADILVWGEAMTRHQFPFGAFTSHSNIYKPWNSMKNCLLHSTTYGGNGTVLAFVRDVLLEEISQFQENRKILRTLDRAAVSADKKVELARKHINSFTNIVYKSTSLEIDLKKAEGSYLYARNRFGRTLRKLDCVGGSGCSMRGHNQQDIINEVLRRHSNTTDYFSALQEKLRGLTGLDQAFQGVSGASVVEMAMMLALMANPGKKKIVVFNGNYAGKTLLAINGTDGDHSMFEPLYSEVVVVNPYVPSARHDLRKVIETGEVALIWFEYIQGGGLLKLPPEIISMVARFKERYQYWVGIDEILNGIHRTGPFLSFDKTMIVPDLNTFAKGLSDMVYPSSMLMISEELYSKAKENYPDHVDFFKRHYLNQLGAHIALHALDKAEEWEIEQNVKARSEYIKKRANSISQKSKLFTTVEIVGLHIRINLNMRAFPFKYYTYEKASRMVTSAFYKKGNIVTFFGRLLPPLNMNSEEAEELVAGIEKVFTASPWYFLKLGVKQYLSTRYLFLMNKIKKIS
jgi:acetylornithine/succinyldiaminopimelate/putrescine aminotransferase